LFGVLIFNFIVYISEDILMVTITNITTDQATVQWTPAPGKSLKF